QQDRVQVNVRIQPGKRKARKYRRAEGAPAASLGARRVELVRPHSTHRGAQAVADEERPADPRHDGDRVRPMPHQRPESADPGRDERHVRDRTDRDDHADVLTPQSLSQHVRVLRADRHDQRKTSSESGQPGRQATHLSDARKPLANRPAKLSYLSLAIVMTDLPFDHVRTLLTAVDEGTFEAAARALHVTPSAISQRIKALEQRTGRVLLVRSKPVRLTESGTAVV